MQTQTIPVLASPVLSLLCWYCFVSIAAGQISRYGQEEHLAERQKHCLCDADPGCINCEPLCEWSCGWMNLRIKEVATAVVSYRWGRRSWGRPLVSTFNGYGMLAVNTHLICTWCKGRYKKGDGFNLLLKILFKGLKKKVDLKTVDNHRSGFDWRENISHDLIQSCSFSLDCR